MSITTGLSTSAWVSVSMTCLAKGWGGYQGQGCARCTLQTMLGSRAGTLHKPSWPPSPNFTLLPPWRPWPCMVTSLSIVLCDRYLKVCAACWIAWAHGRIWPTAQLISVKWRR
jgi:hypothetical protein